MKAIKNIILILLVIFLFSSLLKNLFGYKSKVQFFEQFKHVYETETKRNIVLKTQIVEKKSPEEVEKTIRNDLNLLKENEIALIIPIPTKTPMVVPPKTLSNWEQWWSLFFKKN